MNYIKTNHSNVRITEIEKDRNDYEVKLNNGLELKFDLQENLRKYSD